MRRRRKNKNGSSQMLVGKIKKSTNRIIDFIIVGSSVSLSINNVAGDIASSGDDVTTKLSRMAKRFGGRILGIDFGEGGAVLNIGGAFTNGQFLAGIGASFAAKLLGGAQRTIGTHIIPTGKIAKWGSLNTTLGFGSGLISDNPPSLQSIIQSQLGNGGSGIQVSSGTGGQVAIQ